MMVARKSSAECAASESSASDPDKAPTTALATVSAPEAAIDVSATRSFWVCIDPPSGGARLRDLRGRLAHRFVILADQTRAKVGGCRHVLDAADALTRRPHVLPRTLLVIQMELLRRVQLIGRHARSIDARLKKVAVHAADRRRVDDIVRVGGDNHVLER